MKPRNAAADANKSFPITGHYSNSSVTQKAYGHAVGVGAFWLILVMLSWFEVGLAQSSPQARINEVEVNGGVPDEWFEVYIAGATSFDVSGFKMLDNDDTHIPCVFPAG